MFKDSSVFKVIVGTAMTLTEMIFEVESGFSQWIFSSEKSLKRLGLLYKICKMMFSSYSDYLNKMKVYQRVRLVQVQSWSVEILPIDSYSELDHKNLFVGIFEAGVVTVNKMVKFMSDEGKGRLFKSDNPVVMGSYISLFLKANNCLKVKDASGGWKGENVGDDGEIIIETDDSEDDELYTISDDDSDD